MASNTDAAAQRQFSLDKFAPPFLLRLGALLIDYIIFLLLPVLGLLIDHWQPGGFGFVTDRTLWLLACVVGVFDMIIMPIFTGQSIGKMITGIRIVKVDGERPGFITMLARQTIGYLVTIGTGGLGFLISAVNTSGRTLHDFLTGTTEVRASRHLS